MSGLHEVMPEQIWKWGAHVCTKRRKIFFVVSRHFFGYTNTISHFGERFRDGQYSFVSFLFAVLSSRSASPRPVICKSWEVGMCPPVPYVVSATDCTFDYGYDPVKSSMKLGITCTKSEFYKFCRETCSFLNT